MVTNATYIQSWCKLFVKYLFTYIQFVINDLYLFQTLLLDSKCKVEILLNFSNAATNTWVTIDTYCCACFNTFAAMTVIKMLRS